MQSEKMLVKPVLLSIGPWKYRPSQLSSSELSDYCKLIWLFDTKFVKVLVVIVGNAPLEPTTISTTSALGTLKSSFNLREIFSYFWIFSLAASAR